MTRYAVDCRKMPSDNSCSLRIEGTREEVLKAAAEHAVSSHGHQDGPELRQQLEGIVEEVPGSRL